jgi:hypothetical protein
MMLFAGVLASGCWLGSLRKGDYRDRVTIIERFGRSGTHWYLDFLRGQMRFVVKDDDFALVYVVVPGWAAALALTLAGYGLRYWSLQQRGAGRGFEPQLVSQE